MYYFFVFKQKTAYEMRISDWSSYVCSSDRLRPVRARPIIVQHGDRRGRLPRPCLQFLMGRAAFLRDGDISDLLDVVKGARSNAPGTRHTLCEGDAKAGKRPRLGDRDIIGSAHPDLDRKSTRLNSSH